VNQHEADTASVHAGESKLKPYRALTTPIVQSSTYVFEDSAAIVEHMRRKETGEADRDEYGRYGNPTQRVVERKMARLEGGADALLFDCGMSAVSTTLLTWLSAGDHVILTNDCYRRTRQLCTTFLDRFGVELTIVPMSDADRFAEAVRPNTRLIFSETPTNPYLRILDIERTAAIARRHDLKLVVDVTFATPCNVKPLALGADLVIHSATKYLGGHNDLLAGVAVGDDPLIAELRESQAVMGGVPDPHNAYLLLRGLKTLALRIERQNANGLRVARFLETQPQVRTVYYPGLPSHPDHDLAVRQMEGFGGVVSFELGGDFAQTARFIDALQIPYIGPSLGGVESIIEQPALMSHFALDPDERTAIGIKDELVRYALGIEDADDLIADLAQALEQV